MPGIRGANRPLLPPLLLLALFVLLPLALFLVRSLPGPASLLSILTGDRSLFRIFRFTLLQAAVSALCSVLAALPGAWLLLRYRIPGRELIRAAATLSFILPPILVVLGFTLVYGRAGLVNRLLQALFGLPEPPVKILYTAGGIILAHVFYNFPVALRLLTDLAGLWPEQELKAARSLGATPLRAAVTVLLPALWPGILAALVLVFLYCFLSFAVVLVLGGGPATATLEVELYRAVRFDFNPERAAALILLEGAVTLPLLALYLKLDRWSRNPFSSERRGTLPEKPPAGILILAALYFGLFLLFFLLPLLVIPADSLAVRATRGAGYHFSLEHYTRLLASPEPLKALGHTLAVALVSSLAAVMLLYPAARAEASRRGYDTEAGTAGSMILALPLGISSLALGSGLLYLKTLFPGIGSGIVLIVAHTALALPLAWRVLGTSATALPASLFQAGELIAPPFRRFFRLELPLLFPALATALAFSFALSAGEVNAALLFSGPGFPTLPVTIYRLIGAYRYGEASALGTLLIVTSFCALGILERAGRIRNREGLTAPGR